MGLLVLVFLILPVIILASGFGTKKTRVKVTYGTQQFNFLTDQKTLGQSLVGEGIKLYPQDHPSLPLSTLLDGQTLTLNITRSLPVTIMDGYRKISGRSASTDPAQILADNQVKIYPEDKISESLILDPVTTGSVGLLVQIDRAPSYLVAVDNQIITVRSWNPTVSTILAISKVKINPQDEISPVDNTILVPGETITVTRINVVNLTTTVSVPFQTKNTTSTAVAFGQSRVIQVGVNGQLQETYQVTYKNGIEVSRWLESTVTTVPVQNKIIALGSINGYANYATIYGSMETAFYLSGHIGQSLLVTNLSNGKQVTVKIVDYGPTDGGILDLESDAYLALGGSLGSGHLYDISVSLIDS